MCKWGYRKRTAHEHDVSDTKCIYEPLGHCQPALDRDSHSKLVLAGKALVCVLSKRRGVYKVYSRYIPLLPPPQKGHRVQVKFRFLGKKKAIGR